MESLDFVITVIPLSIIVATLAALVYYYAHRDEINSRKNAKLIQAFLEKRVKQQTAIRHELDHVESLYKNRNIDKSTYQSLQNVILMSQEKQRFEAITTFSERNKGLNRETEVTLESPQVGKGQDSWLENEVLRQEEERVDDEADGKAVEMQAKKPAKKTKTKKKKETEMGVISSLNTSESNCEEELDVSTT